jgi:acyl-[acyl-carrier-protein]-phospholipid O-acyltransferase/long-chain-fatty-acid--[acyl-carrier-protein] ligase
MRTLLRWLLRLCFRFRAENLPVLEAPGPVLLVPNHVSWLDWLFVGVCLPGDWKFVVSSVTAQTSWVHRRIMLNRRSVAIDPASPFALKQLAAHLRAGGRRVLLAEGRLSCTGSLMKLYECTGFLLHKTPARVISCYLRGATRLRWSRNPGWRRWLAPVSAHFGAVLTPPKLTQVSGARARSQLTEWLRDRMVQQQFEVEMQFGPPHVLAAVIESARRCPRREILEDVQFKPVTYRRLLVGAELLARQWPRRLLAGQERVGVLLPNVAATPVALLSLWAVDKVPAVLNYSLGAVIMLTCARLAGLKQIITSRAFLERTGLNIEPLAQAGLQFVYLEDVRAAITGAQKLAALCRLTLQPAALLRHMRRRPARSGPADERAAVVLFTSGSEDLPKGVELSHANLLANIRQMLAVSDAVDSDRMFNCLPLFHSFGLTVGALLPLVRGFYVFVHLSPLHYKLAPANLYDRNCTIFLSTNTFLNGYARKAHPYDFRTVRHLFAAAEKLQETTRAVWAERFGVRLLEGYGATECAPAISLNTPFAARAGSVGRLLPGIEYRLAPVEDLPEGGRLLVRGPNVMRGYLNADANAHFQALGGWYDTGDIARTDADGYLYILGRLKRFAKIGGEMISLAAVEDALAGAFPHYGPRCAVAVLARPDPHKGETLLAVTNEPRLQPDDLRRAVLAKGLPALCVPRELKCVREIPRLGSGKINHRALAGLIGAQP